MTSHEVFFPTTQPEHWLESALPQLELKLPPRKDLDTSTDSIEKALGKIQTARWEKETGVPCDQTHFTVVIPIHNEARALPSHLATLMHSDIPDTVDAQFLFIVNGSTDKSRMIVEQFLHRIGNPEEDEVHSQRDPKLKPKVLFVRRNRVVFTLLETPTASKANALNIGNEFAVGAGHNIAISIDSDQFVEANSIRQLYSESNQLFTNEPGKFVFADGIVKQQPPKVVDFQDNIVAINGQMFAWKPSWVKEADGFPLLLNEDYAAGFQAVTHGHGIYHGESTVWGHSPSTRADKYRLQVRITHGALQLLASLDKGQVWEKSILANDYYLLRPFIDRMRYYMQVASWKTLPGVFKIIRRTIYNELSLIDAKIRFYRNPKAKTWKPTNSTK